MKSMEFFKGFGGGEPIISNADSTLITEAVLLEGLSAEECASICEDTRFTDELIKSEIVTEKTIIKLDKKAKLKGATRTAVYTIARQRKDPKFKKLLTLWRMEAQIEKELYKKYHNEALLKAKKSLSSKPTSSLPSVSNQGKNTAAVKNAISKAKAQLKTH